MTVVLDVKDSEIVPELQSGNSVADERLSALVFGIDQIVLRAEQVERVAVTKVVLGPGLAVGGFILPDHEDGDVRLLRGFSGGFDAVLLRGRIDQLYVVGEPAMPVIRGAGDFAALGVNDIRFGADAVLTAPCIVSANVPRWPPGPARVP